MAQQNTILRIESLACYLAGLSEIMKKEVFVGLRAERPNKAKHAVAHDGAGERQEGGNYDGAPMANSFYSNCGRCRASSALLA